MLSDDYLTQPQPKPPHPLPTPTQATTMVAHCDDPTLVVDGAPAVHWCMWDQSTWISSFDSQNREQVRRAMLQAKIELSMTQLANDSMGVSGAFRAYQRVLKRWNEVK